MTVVHEGALYFHIGTVLFMALVAALITFAALKAQGSGAEMLKLAYLLHVVERISENKPLHDQGCTAAEIRNSFGGLTGAMIPRESFETLVRRGAISYDPESEKYHFTPEGRRILERGFKL